MTGPQARFARELRKLYSTAKVPSYKELATKAGLPKTWVYDLFSGNFVKAPDWDRVQAVVAACVEFGGDDPELRRLGDLPAWRRMHDLLEPGEPQRAGSVVTRSAAKRPVSPTIDLWEPERLGVHRAVQLGDSIGATLTPYLPRPHDERVRGALRRGHRLVVVTGETCTGKTRTLLEAVRCELADLPVLRPYGPRELLRRAEAGDLARPGVLWLNELHSFLDPDRDAEVVDALAQALSSPDGVVILGATQTPLWESLLGKDQERGIVGEFLVAALRVAVPESFGGDADTGGRLRDAARQDSRIAYALSAASDGRVIQALTGGPALLEMLRNPDHALAAALVAAAVDGTRLTGTDEVPSEFLRVAAGSYLAPEQRTQNATWFDEAVAQAIEPIRGIQALTPLRLARVPGPAEAYRPHDYVVQHLGRDHAVVPAATWDALLEHVPGVDARLEMGRAAAARGLRRIAACALLPIADDARAVDQMIGVNPEPEHWYRFGAEAGSDLCIWRLAMDAGESGDRAEAARWWRQELAISHGRGMSDQIGALGELGLLEDAVEWLRLDVESGNKIALFATVRLLSSLGRDRDVVEMLAAMADAGDEDAMHQTARAYAGLGNQSEHRRWLIKLADAGSSYAMGCLAELGDESKDWTRHAAALGKKWAIRALAEGAPPLVAAGLWRVRDSSQAADLYEKGGDWAAAAEVWRPRAQVGEDMAMRLLGEILWRSGDLDEAEVWLRKAATGSRHSRGMVARFLVTSGRVEEGLDIVARDAEGGDHTAIGSYVDVSVAAGRTEEIVAWLRTRAEDGSVVCMRHLAELLNSAEWRERAARAGQGDLARRVAREYREDGRRLNEAIDILRSAADTDRRSANLMIELLQQAGATDEAEQRLRSKMEWDVGNGSTSHNLATFLRSTGRPDEAERVRRYGIEPGGRTADPWRMTPPD